MADITQINHNLDNAGNVTVLNRDIAPRRERNDSSVTALNPHVMVEAVIVEGMELCGKYRVVEKLAVAAGEADLYLCEFETQRYVAKVYRRTDAVKAEVIEKLKTLDCPYVAKVYDITQHRGASVEVLPYYTRGSLQGKTFTYEQLREHIIPCLIEALKALHDAGIIHKDLKPSNIMITDDQNGVAIIDFGISSVTEEGSTVIITKTGMTPEYSAPETFKGLFSSYADYYSLGITLYELFCGKTPYNNMTAEEIEQYNAVQRIPFPENMPVELQELIRALTYFDISARREKDNPNCRWNYEQVRNWLDGVVQTIPGEGVDRRTVKPYAFAGTEYSEKSELVQALIENWTEGKKQLFRGLLSNYFKPWDSRSYQLCMEAEREATRTSGKDDKIFWKTMYALDPKKKDFFWKGKTYAGLPAMGRDLLEHLRQNDPSMNDFMESIFREDVLSAYVSLMEPNNEVMLDSVRGLEAMHRAYDRRPREQRVNLYLTAYMLSGQKILYVAGQEFHTLDEFSAYLRELLGENNENLPAFKEFCHKLVDHYQNLIPPLESWLIALGKRDELEQWKQAMVASE